jgi:LysM repeat protein
VQETVAWQKLKGENFMSTYSNRVTAFRLKGILTVMILSAAFTGCYTRQIEGIQKDLDLMDRKLHKANLDPGETSSAVSPHEIIQLKQELETVQSQQMGLSSDLESLKSGVGTASLDSMGPYPVPADLPDSQEIEMLRKEIADNQKQIDRFDREIKEMQATFDEVKASMLEVIELIQEEYIEEGAEAQPVSSPSAQSLAPEISMAPTEPAPSLASSSGARRTYEVKAGDSLNLIAKRTGVSVEQLKSMNQISDPNTLYRGQKIYIP